MFKAGKIFPGKLLPLAVFLLLGIAIFFLFQPSADKRNFTLNETMLRKKVSTLAEQMKEKFSEVDTIVTQLASETVKAYEESAGIISRVDKSMYKFSGKVLYREINGDVPAVFVSGAIPIDETVLQSVYLTEGIDQSLRKVVANNTLIAQAYYNDKNSLNRIYPPFDVLTQYEPGMVIPEFNFYFLADEKHNPDKGIVWVDEPYIDPAGRGWMISCICPVYLAGKLEGVIGADITLDLLTEKWVAGVKDFSIILLAQNGQIINGSPPAFSILCLPNLLDHKYTETIKSNTYLPEHFNLLKSPVPEVRKISQELVTSDSHTVMFRTIDKNYVIHSKKIKSLNWFILGIVEI